VVEPLLSERLERDASLAQAFRDAWDRAVSTWPAVELGREELLAYLDERVAAEQDLDAVCVEDLFLACACALGRKGAIEAFDRAFAGDLDAAVRGAPEASLSAADLRQALHEKLFTRAAESPPKIAEYSGKGSLRAWVKVAALRMRIDAERSRKARREMHDADLDMLAALPDAQGNPELLHMRAHYREVFQKALATAFERLEPKQRNLLRQKVTHRLGHTELAALHHVHDATIKRWLGAIREKLLEETRREVQHALGLREQELESVMRMLGSHLDISVQRYLETHSDPE
jgi:RNA polymerase sigma-70 factor, ECF subfamily